MSKSVNKSITKSNFSISNSINLALQSNKVGITGINGNIFDNISKGLKNNSFNLANIQGMVSSVIDFDGMIKPLSKVAEFVVGLSGNKIIEFILSNPAFTVFKEIDKYNKVREGDHITSFEGFMKWSNDIWAILAGIRPFNIILGKESWLDDTKRGLYYDITRGFIFSYIMITWGMGALNSFFSTMSDQKIKEHYAYSKLSIQDYQKLEFRGILKEGELDDMAHFLGYNERAKELVNKISKFYPSVRDTIDFAVREAFDPDPELFIHDANAIPAPFIEIASKLGIDDKWIKKFWHSHWRLLGAGQILEAFHRKIMTETELLDYLRRLDYVDNDRKILMEMSFNLLTRVDVRRIFENGLISSKELFDYYGTLGFNERDQLLMTVLAKKLRFIDAIDLRKHYIEMYENGLVNDKEISNLLSETGLDSDEIRDYLELSNSQKELDFKIELKKRIELRFYEGDIDFEILIKQLRNLGVSDREIRRIENNAILFDFTKVKLPTLAELKRYYKKEIIDLNKFVYYALRLGLAQEHIFWILQDISS